MSQDNNDDANKDDKTEDPFEGFEYEGSDKDADDDSKNDDDKSSEDDKDSSDASTTQDDDSSDDSADDSDDDSNASKDDKSDDDDADDDKKVEKKKQSVNERIAAITKKRRDAERAAEQEASRSSALEEENRALKEKLGLTDDADKSKAENTAPDPKDYEYGELDEKYTAAREKYLRESIIAEVRAEQDQTRQAEAAESKIQERRELLDVQIEQGVTKFEDYEKVVFEGPLKDMPPASDEAAEMILKSPHSADLMYHMAQNPDEVKEVLDQSPIEQARYIGKLEARFSSESAETKEKPKPKAKAPKAQAPLTRTRGGDGKFSAADDTPDFAAFEAKYT